MRFLARASLALVALVANPLAETKIMRIVDHIHVGAPDQTKAAVVTLSVIMQRLGLFSGVAPV
jgi:hypothetical protein